MGLSSKLPAESRYVVVYSERKVLLSFARSVREYDIDGERVEMRILMVGLDAAGKTTIL